MNAWASTLQIYIYAFIFLVSEFLVLFKLGVLETGTALLLRSARTGKHTLTTTHAVIDIQGKQGLSRQKYISYIYTGWRKKKYTRLISYSEKTISVTFLK
jgi:hypothetical protein